MCSHILSHLPPIFANGTSLTRAHEHSTTAAPYSSRSWLSAGEMVFFAFGLQCQVSSSEGQEALETHDMTTPANFWPICNPRISPSFISF